MSLDRRHIIGGVFAAFTVAAAGVASAQPAGKGWNCTGQMIQGPDKKPFCTQWTRQGGAVGASGQIAPPPAVVRDNRQAAKAARKARRRRRRHRR